MRKPRGKSTKTCTFAPNAFGLCDMHGNVMEWVEDIYFTSYSGALGDASARVAGGESSRRVQRGGSWIDGPRRLRAAARNYAEPVQRFPVTGFRVARNLP